MTDAAYLELLAGFEAAIDAASFALKTAVALAEGTSATRTINRHDG